MTALKRIIPFWMILCFTNATGQKNSENTDYLAWFDATIGIENTPIFDGLGYVEQYKSINEKHKFFTSQTFLNGSMNYEGQLYPQLKLKYDIYHDEIVINLEEGFDVVALQPEKNKINNFTIGGHYFENLGFPEEPDKEISGFFEILFAAPTLKLLKKHRKKRLMKIKGVVYYEFLENSFNVLSYKGKYQIVDSNRDFKKLFPEFKKEIKKYKIRKLDKDRTIKALVQRLHLLISTKDAE